MADNNWFNFLLALTTISFAAVGGLVMLLHSLTWKKLDRMTMLFIADKRSMEDKISGIENKVYSVEAEHLRDMRQMETRLPK